MAHPKYRDAVDPLHFLLDILADPAYGLENRKWAAVQVLPYTKSKMPLKVESTVPADDAAAQIRETLAALDTVTAGEAPDQLPVRKRVKLLEDV